MANVAKGDEAFNHQGHEGARRETVDVAMREDWITHRWSERMRVMRRIGRSVLLLIVMATVNGGGYGQTKQQQVTLKINGESGTAEAIDQNGRLFVDVAKLLSVGKGSMSFVGPNMVVLTIPAGASGAPTGGTAASPAAASQPANSAALSQEFMKAGIEEIAQLREWATTLGSAIRGGYGVTDEWVNGYRDQASQSLGLADAAASTEGDRNAAQLLHRAFNLVQQWSDKLVAEKKSMDTAKYATSPNALREDPLSQKLINCGHFVTRMLGGGVFQDDASCH
jgi:hypothetical protein